ncbi:MAG: hypothetical protein QME66_09485 [Candidatus Eisenbacteria bacterium]|nr:hypothetical protein [Candidatus Eisenbacteria bacterium]
MMVDKSLVLKMSFLTGALLFSFISLIALKAHRYPRYRSTLSRKFLKALIVISSVFAVLFLPLVFVQVVVRGLPISQYWQDLLFVLDLAVSVVVLLIYRKVFSDRIG